MMLSHEIEPGLYMTKGGHRAFISIVNGKNPNFPIHGMVEGKTSHSQWSRAGKYWSKTITAFDLVSKYGEDPEDPIVYKAGLYKLSNGQQVYISTINEEKGTYLGVVGGSDIIEEWYANGHSTSKGIPIIGLWEETDE